MENLGLVQGKTATESGIWHKDNISPYTSQTILDIIDNQSQNLVLPISSIPSPFARMHLVSAAFDNFDYIKPTKSLYDKLISDCLDVFEMLYRIDELKLRNRLKITHWKEDNLVELKKISEDYANTIELHINSYNTENQFKKYLPFSSFALILIDDKIIAGTSPFTGFFTTANNIDIIIDLHGKRKFFEGDPVHLWQRDPDFQKYLNVFFRSTSLFERLIPIYKYIVESRKKVNDVELKRWFNAVNNKSVTDTLTNYPEFVGEELQISPGIIFRIKNFTDEDIESVIEKSDFIAQSKKSLLKRPLVLMNGLRNDWTYFGAKLPSNFSLPKNPSQDYNNRIAPSIPIPYPYVQPSDFLTDFIVELPYQINHTKFFTSNIKESKKGYLLPLKPDYFKFFTFEDLKEQLKITVNQINGEIEQEYIVELKIKVQKQGQYIIFKKKYIHLENTKNIYDSDIGGIIDGEFGIGFYPFFKLTKDKLYNNFYKVFCYYDTNQIIELRFYKWDDSGTNIKLLDSQEDKNINRTRTRAEENQIHITDYYELSNDPEKFLERDITYDFIVVNIIKHDSNIETVCILIPIMEEIGNLSESETIVSFDIGTTNTYVAISTKENEIDALTSRYNNISGSNEMQLVMLHKPAKDDSDFYGSEKYDFNSKSKQIYNKAQLNEFMPSWIGEGSQFKFPIKTVICYDNDIQHNIKSEGNLSVLSNINIPFAFGQKEKRVVDCIQTNLKWNSSNNNSGNSLTNAFITELVILARNSILLKRHNPANSTIIWTSPLSMGENLKDNFNNTWEINCNKYFNPSNVNNANNKIIPISESVAPIFFNQPTVVGDYFLNVDLGGGTTDIVVKDRDKILLVSSFRFAGNALFGNGLEFNKSGQNNGIANKYADLLIKAIPRSEQSEFEKILIDLKDDINIKSEDLINFFFSRDEFSNFLKQDEDLKILLLLHNASVFYHIAQLLNDFKINIPPGQIGLSGNGAKLLVLANGSDNINGKRKISALVTEIFNKVYNRNDSKLIELVLSKNPKEATAHGGIKGIKYIQDLDLESIFIVGLGTEADVLNKDELKKLDYKDLLVDSELLTKVENNVKKFYNFFFDELWLKIDFVEYFGVNNKLDRNAIKKEMMFLITDVLKSAISSKVNDQNEQKLTETLFFYPIIHGIYELSKQLCNPEGVKKFIARNKQ